MYSAAATAAATARSSVETAAASARTSLFRPGEGPIPSLADAFEDDEEEEVRIVYYLAVGRNEGLLGEVVDPYLDDDDRDFAIALGRKMIRRKAPAGWDEISSGRHHAIRLPVHDIEGCTSYILVVGHTCPADRAQAFVQKLALMLDPMVEKCAGMPSSKRAIESASLVIQPVLERELQRGNSGVRTHEIENQELDVKAIIKQNVEVMLDRDEKAAEPDAKSTQLESAALVFKKKTRALKRLHLSSQIRWRVTAGVTFTTSSATASPPASSREHEAQAGVEESDDAEAEAMAAAAMAAAAEAAGSGVFWICPACTFANSVDLDLCSMCGTPKTGQRPVPEDASVPTAHEEARRAAAREAPPLFKGAARECLRPGGTPAQKASVPQPTPTAKAASGPPPQKSASAPAPPQKAAPKAATKASPKPAPTPAPKVAPKPAPKPEPPQSPRTQARSLVGSKLSSEQAAKAADAILMLQPYVEGKRTATVDQIWTFFDVPKPPGNSFREGDAVSKTLRGKINRQRLLLHPDKNAHPAAEKTFKYLEQCNQRLTNSCMRKEAGESAKQRAEREERERHEETERRRKQEEERLAKEAERQREEDEKEKQAALSADEKVRKAEAEIKRREWLLRGKQALDEEQALRLARQRGPVTAASAPSADGPPSTPLGDAAPLDEAPPEPVPAGLPAKLGPQGSGASPTVELVGKLKVTIIGAKGLPPGGLFLETDAYAVIHSKHHKFQTRCVPGRNPRWDDTFEFNVNTQDTFLRITLWREGWGFNLLGHDFLGRVDIPFLDIDDWSGCVIGRMVESADPEATECMELELKLSIEWF